MPIYTADANGVPFVVLRADNPTAARAVLDNPVVTVELATRNDASGKLVWAGVTPLALRPSSSEEAEKWQVLFDKAKAENPNTSDGSVFLLIETTMARSRPGLTPWTLP